MNLYDLHTDPKSLYGYDRADMEVPEVFWNKYENKPKELEKREVAIAKNPKFAYRYAYCVLRGPFSAGETAIATTPELAYYYARYVLQDRFPAGEAVISKNASWSYTYAHDVIKGQFLAGEISLAKESLWANLYAQRCLPNDARAAFLRSVHVLNRKKH